MASTHRQEQMDERFARHLRESRQGATFADEPQRLVVGLEYEGWFQGDPAGTHPEPETDHQPNFEEPLINTLGWGWDSGAPEWLYVPDGGMYHVALNYNFSWTLFLDGPGGYHGIETVCRPEFWRSIPAGDAPLGRSPETDPLFPGSYSGGGGLVQDQNQYPEGVEDVDITKSFSGPLMEIGDDGYLRVLARIDPIAAFATDDEFFLVQFQGTLSVEYVADLP